MKLKFLLLILSSILLGACTRQAPDMSRVSVYIPNSESLLAKGLSIQAKVGALGSMSKWALPAPANYSDINCFAIMIHAPDLSDPAANSCLDMDANIKATPQFIAGGFLPGTAQTIEVPTGLGRTVYLVGFHTSSPSYCIDLAGNTSAARFASAQFSPPVILAQNTVDLTVGDVAVDMTVTNVLSSSSRFEDCAPALFSSDVSPDEPTALLAHGGILSAVNSLSSATVTVSGPYVYEYEYALIYNGVVGCTAAAFNGTFVSLLTNPVITLSPSYDGNYDLCVRARSASGKVQTVPSQISWARDTAAPVGNPSISLVGLAVSNDSTPTLTVSSIPGGSSEVVFYMNANCDTQIASAPVTGASFDVTLPALPTDGSLEFYALTRDAAGNKSVCAGPVSYLLDRVAPTVPADLSARYGTSLQYTPLHTWGAATDVGTSVASYQVALGSGSSGAELNNLSDWQTISNSQFSYYYFLSPLLVNGDDRYFSVRAVDAAGNPGAITTQKFRVDMAADWEVQKYVKASDAKAEELFGHSVAIEGDYMVVGAASGDRSGEGSSDVGSAYVYKRLGNEWVQQARLDAMADRMSGDQFGFSVAISGDTIAVGAPYEDHYIGGISSVSIDFTPTTGGANDSGAVYIFKKAANGDWKPQAYIKPSDPSNGAKFGSALSLSGDKLVVGAPFTTNGGKVYEFTRDISTWTTGNVAYGSTAAQFGSAVSFSGTTVAIGAPGKAEGMGAVYIYRTTSGTWIADNILMPASGTVGDVFGSSLQLFDGRLIVGAPGEDSYQREATTTAAINNDSVNSGAAYYYEDGETGFALKKYLKAPNSMPGDAFGASVAIWGTTIVAGAPGEDQMFSGTAYWGGSVPSNPPDSTNSGALYVYQIGATHGDWQAYLKPTNTKADVQFQLGGAVAISGSAIAAGAKYEDADQIGLVSGASSDNAGGAVPGSGAVYLFDVYDDNPNPSVTTPGPQENPVNPY